MKETPLKNLSIQCADLGHKLAEGGNITEKVLNEALAVLEEQGPYAMFLYLKARHGKGGALIGQKSLCFLKVVFRHRLQETGDILDAIKELAEDLDDLLFARDLLRMALSYARYHLKAKDNGSS